MKKIVTSTLFIVIVICVTLPFFLNSTTNNSLVVSSNMISALASLATLFIAVLLYSKYGVEKSILDKQTETVLRLLTELKKTRFLCEWSDGVLQLRLDRLQDKYWKEYEDKKLLFDGGYAEGLKDIWDITEDVFLPVEIADKIDPLIVQVIIGDQKRKDYMVVEIPGYPQKLKENHFFGLLNGKQMTVREFVLLWSAVTDATKKWLKEHSSISFDLNFEKK